MAKVEWVKITTDMFDNRKIRYLRRLPEGNNIVLIWVMLLTLAGRCNAGGMIFLTEDIPYSPAMLADELGFKESTVTVALQALERMGMISATDDGAICLPGWEDHQNVAGLDKIRTQTKRRVAEYRERQKQALLPERDGEACSADSNDNCNDQGNADGNDNSKDSCNESGNVTVTGGNATEKNKNKKENREEEDILLGAEAPETKKRFTPPSTEAVAAYCRERRNGIDAAAFMDYYGARNWMLGKTKMKDWRAAVRTWEHNRKGGGGGGYARPESDHSVTGNFGTIL